jgi:hypothetical protein
VTDLQIPPRLIVAVVLALVGLLVIVVGVGLARNQIDPQALALALVPAVTGLMLGLGARRKNNGDDK